MELNSAEILAGSAPKPSTFWRLKNSNINLGAQNITITSDAVNNIIRYTGVLAINGANAGNLLMSPNAVGVSGRALTDKFLMVQKSWTYNNAAPTSGDWVRGDIVWNSDPNTGLSPGWVCIEAGTPGRWKAMANLQ